MEPIDYRGALARGWRLIVVVGLIGLVVGLLLPSSSGTPVWKSTSLVGALPADTSPSGTGGPLSTGVPTDQILFYASTDEVFAAAASFAKLNTNAAVVRDEIRTTGPGTNASGNPVGQPGVVQVQANGPTEADSVDLNNAFDYALELKVDSEAAAEIKAQQVQVFNSIMSVQAQLDGVSNQAGVTATALESELTALESRQGQLAVESPSTGFTVLQMASNATESSTPVLHSRPLRGLIGLLLGVILGGAVALVVALFDKRLRTAARAGEAFGYPVVAEIHDQSLPSTEEYRMLALAVLTEPLARRSVDAGGAADDYELRYDRLDLVPTGVGAGAVAGDVVAPARGGASPDAAPGRRQVVLVASPGGEPTRAVVGAALATSCAESGRKVVVISTGAIPIDSAPTYAAPAPVDPAQVAALLEDTSVPGVSVLPMDQLATHTSQFLSVAPAVIAALRDLVDLVIIDVPPLLSVHHGEGLVPMVDVVVVVAEYRLTTSEQLRRAGDLLERLSAPVSGLVFANVPDRSAKPVTTDDGAGDAAGPDDERSGDAEVERQMALVSSEAEPSTADPTSSPSAVPEEPRRDGDPDPNP